MTFDVVRAMQARGTPGNRVPGYREPPTAQVLACRPRQGRGQLATMPVVHPKATTAVAHPKGPTTELGPVVPEFPEGELLPGGKTWIGDGTAGAKW